LDHRNGAKRFRRIAAAGVFFQGGAAAVDSSTIIAALVYGLTSSPLAVGAATAILRFGWLFPQLFVAYLARYRRRRLPFYMVGAFGRTACLAAVAIVLATADALPWDAVVGLFFLFWTAYAFVSGIVAVPYNDIVARSVASQQRSRLLAIRFFGGGIVAIGVAALAHRLLAGFSFPTGYALLVAAGAALMLVSTLFFVSAGEPLAPQPRSTKDGFVAFLTEGVAVFCGDRRFRLFVYAQWLGGFVMMALPFYVLQVIASRGTSADIAVLLGAQTAGALVSNALWGWWGDRYGKQSLLEGVAALRAGPPALVLALMSLTASGAPMSIAGFVVVFMLLGALVNGSTIAMLGYLMEISPDDRRPAYSGYFNALVAPAALLPLAGAAIVAATSLAGVFVVSLAASALQYPTVRRLRAVRTEEVGRFSGPVA
jgi:Major Facilitator Superfamily